MTRSAFWELSHRADATVVPLADRHYNRQKIGAPQFVPPGRCVVLATPARNAFWVTSWPFAEYVRHAWAGAWVNSCFRKECDGDASDFILAAVSVTRWKWPEVPSLGIVTFVDPSKVRGVRRRGKMVFGYCYMRAGFRHVGFTKGGLWAWQLTESDMPSAQEPLGCFAFA